MDELKVGDLAVRASFEVSFASLPESVTPGGVALARAFRTLGLWQAPSIGLSAAAAMLSEPETAVADALEFLVDAHLLESSAPDTYSFHDLLRVYAAERGLVEEPEQARADSVCRLADWYLHTAGAADSVVTPWRERVPLGPVQTGIRPLAFATPERALEWFAAERENLVPATRQAAGYGCHEVAWKLPVALLGCFDLLGYRTEWLDTHQIALTSARQTGDRNGEAGCSTISAWFTASRAWPKQSATSSRPWPFAGISGTSAAKPFPSTIWPTPISGSAGWPRAWTSWNGHRPCSAKPAIATAREWRSTIWVRPIWPWAAPPPRSNACSRPGTFLSKPTLRMAKITLCTIWLGLSWT